MRKLFGLVLTVAAMAAGASAFPAQAEVVTQTDSTVCQQTECPNLGAQVCAVVTVPVPEPGEGTIAYNCYQRLIP